MEHGGLISATGSPSSNLICLIGAQWERMCLLLLRPYGIAYGSASEKNGAMGKIVYGWDGEERRERDCDDDVKSNKSK